MEGHLDALLITVVALLAMAIAAGVIRRHVGRVTSSAPAPAAVDGVVDELRRVVGDLTADAQLPVVLRGVAAAAVELLGGDAAGYLMVVRGMPAVAAVHRLPVLLLGQQLSAEDGFVRSLDGANDPVAVVDLGHLPADAEVRKLAPSDDLHTLAAAPTVVRGAMVGILYVVFRAARRRLTDPELDLLRLLAGHAGAAVERAATHGKLLQHRDHEQAVIEAIAEGVAVIGPDGAVHHWNAAAAEITGVTADEAVGRPAPLPYGQPGETVEHQLPSGRWVVVRATYLSRQEQVLDIRDVTKEKELEEAKNLFLTTTSHELKTPVTVISGYASTLLNQWDALGEGGRKEALEALARRAESLATLVEQLLLVSRAEAGTLEVEVTSFDVRPVLKMATAGFEALSDHHRLVVDLPLWLPLVLGDAASVDTVVGQLIENAYKYSPDGGEVRVTARALDGHVAVTVSDEGIGLREDEADRVFGRFYQGDAGDTRRFGGVGLGLYIVRRLVEAQGGSVTARTRPGRGATFEFTLRRADR